MEEGRHIGNAFEIWNTFEFFIVKWLAGCDFGAAQLSTGRNCLCSLHISSMVVALSLCPNINWLVQSIHSLFIQITKYFNTYYIIQSHIVGTAWTVKLCGSRHSQWYIHRCLHKLRHYGFQWATNNIQIYLPVLRNTFVKRTWTCSNYGVFYCIYVMYELCKTLICSLSGYIFWEYLTVSIFS